MLKRSTYLAFSIAAFFSSLPCFAGGASYSERFSQGEEIGLFRHQGQTLQAVQAARVASRSSTRFQYPIPQGRICQIYIQESVATFYLEGNSNLAEDLRDGLKRFFGAESIRFIAPGDPDHFRHHKSVDEMAKIHLHVQFTGEDFMSPRLLQRLTDFLTNESWMDSDLGNSMVKVYQEFLMERGLLTSWQKCCMG